jgi:hypothetical protein
LTAIQLPASPSFNDGTLPVQKLATIALPQSLGGLKPQKSWQPPRHRLPCASMRTVTVCIVPHDVSPRMRR